jgi:hypothetical protein
MIMKYSPWQPEEINVRTARGFNHTIRTKMGKSPRYPEPFGQTIKMVPLPALPAINSDAGRVACLRYPFSVVATAKGERRRRGWGI